MPGKGCVEVESKLAGRTVEGRLLRVEDVHRVRRGSPGHLDGDRFEQVVRSRVAGDWEHHKRAQYEGDRLA